MLKRHPTLTILFLTHNPEELQCIAIRGYQLNPNGILPQTLAGVPSSIQIGLGEDRICDLTRQFFLILGPNDATHHLPQDIRLTAI